MPDYRELAPPPDLAPWVACTWTTVASGDGRPVLPDGCVDIVWLDGRLVVAGPDTGPVHEPIERGAPVVGLRFRPGAAPCALGVAADELTDGRPLLSSLWGAVGDRLAEQVAEDGTPAPLVREVRRRLAEAPPPDPLVQGLVASLPAPVHEVARDLGIGERQLHRRTLTAVGYGPKTLDRVLRFRRFLRLSERGGTLARLAAEAGYADQAHLAREVRRLAGTTPSALVG